MKRIIHALAIATGVYILYPGTTFAASVIAGITTGFPGSTINNTANLTSITSNGGQTITNLVGPTDVSYTATSPGTYRGSAGSGTPAAIASLLGLDVATGITSNVSRQVINVIFPTSDTFRIFLFDVSEGTTVESGFTMQAILGGSTSSPVLGGSIFTLPTTWGDSGRDLDGFFPATSFSFVQNIIGYAVDKSDLGVASLIGVQISAPAGADPAAVVAAVPEPSSILLGAFGLISVSLRRIRNERRYAFTAASAPAAHGAPAIEQSQRKQCHACGALRRASQRNARSRSAMAAPCQRKWSSAQPRGSVMVESAFMV